MPDAATEPVPSRSELRSYRDLHRRSYEIELLISGAVLFGVLQVPGPVDEWFHRLDPRLGGLARDAAYVVYYYVKLTLYTVVTALTVHLAVRAYWVGLIGLNSIFPRGVRWDSALMGPAQKDVLKARAPSLRSLMRGADALASVVFSAAFSLVWIFLLSTLYFAVMGVVALLASTLLLGGRYLGPLVVALGAGPFIVTAMVALADRALGDRVDPGGPLGRGLRRVLGFSYYALLQGFYAPLTNVLMSNVPRRVVRGVTWGGMLAMASVFIVKDMLVPAGALRVGGGGFIPDLPAGYGVVDGYYDDRRSPPWSSPRDPSIASDVVTGAYVRLFVPFHADRDPELLEALCPGLERLGAAGVRLVTRRARPPEDAAMEATLGCMARLWTVTLDGAPVGDPGWRFATRPGTDIPGLVAYLPARGLAPGEHVLELEKARPGDGPAAEAADARPPDDEAPDGGGDPPIRHVIPFWR